MKRVQKRFLVMVAGASLPAVPAFAHAAEQGFVLLLPTTAYITGGTLAVAATILLLAVLRAGQLKRVFTPFQTGIGRRGMTLATPQVAASAILMVLIWVGLTGPTDPQANLMPLVLWTVWWMALFVVQGVFVDVWRWVNPWVGLHRLVLPDHAGWWRMPDWVSIWPAMMIFLAFQSFVLADTAPNDPERLASFAACYWGFTFLGMTLFGRAAWLRHVECFTVLFNLIGLMRVAKNTDGLALGCPGWQAFAGPDVRFSHAIFILILLGAGSFDGLHETFWWLAQLGVNPLEYPGRSAMIVSTTLGLLGAIGLLIVIYAAVVFAGVRLIAQQDRAYGAAFVQFSVTLLPIAIGYHFAHYFVTFLVQIQFVAANLADPFALGWNLLGLGAVQVKVGFLAQPEIVRLIWLTQAGVVVISHILAVLISHRTAEILCRTHADVLKIQMGLSLLMVAYTVFGLWLLASPRGV